MSYSIPSLLTGTRFFCGAFILPYLFITTHYGVIPPWFCAIFYLLIALTDFFDGFYARKNNICTVEGGIADFIADKCFFFSMLSTAAMMGALPLWFMLISITREWFVVGMRMILLTQRKSLPSVKVSAKIKTTFQHILFIALILKNTLIAFVGIPMYISLLTMLIFSTTAFSLYSSMQYMHHYIHSFTQKGS